MKIVNENLSEEINKINETIMSVQDSLPAKVTNTIFYTKLKYLMFSEIVKFCREKLELKQDLLNLRTFIGEFISEEDIRKMFDELKEKYNNVNDNIGMDYHIEATRIDYGVCLFVMLKRGDIVFAKKFVFRFRKSQTVGFDFSNITSGGIEVPNIKKDILDIGGKNNEV